MMMDSIIATELCTNSTSTTTKLLHSASTPNVCSTNTKLLFVHRWCQHAQFVEHQHQVAVRHQRLHAHHVHTTRAKLL